MLHYSFLYTLTSFENAKLKLKQKNQQIISYKNSDSTGSSLYYRINVCIIWKNYFFVIIILLRIDADFINLFY